MAFTVDDFQDLLRLLEARPDWRAELRRLLLPSEILELPTVVRQLADEVRLLADAQRRTEALIHRLIEAQTRAEQRLSAVEERVGRLEEGQARLEERVGRLEEGQIRLEAALARLAEAQARTEERVGRLEEGQARLEEGQARLEEGQAQLGERVARTDEAVARIEVRVTRTEARVADLRGDNLERRYRDHAGGYFGRLLHRARVVGQDELDDLLDEGLAAGAFDREDADDVRLADLVVRGRRPDDAQATYLVVEVSGVVEPADVERAARRAELLGRVRTALAVVAGEEITQEATDLAQARAVWRLSNGRIEPPTAS